MSEREFDVVVIGAGPAGEVCAGRLGEARARGGDRRVAPDRRRVLLLRLHAVEGRCSGPASCSPRCAASRACARRSRATSTQGRCSAAATRSSTTSTTRRRCPGSSSAASRSCAAPGRLDGERRVRAGDDTLVGAQGRGGGHRQLAADPADRRPARGRAVDEPRGHHRQGGARRAWRSWAAAWWEWRWRRPTARSGRTVTLIERGDRLIAREEPFASDDVEQSLRENGVDVQLGVAATAVRAEGGEVTLELDSGGPVRADELLVAIGRRLNSDEIGLDTVGLEPGKPVEVDDSMRAPDHDWLYAIGDVNGRALLTHMGKYQARIAADVILGYPSGCVRLERRRLALAARDLHRPARGGRGLHARRRPAGRAERPRGRRVDPGQRRRELLRPRRHARHHAARGRRRPQRHRRRDLHRPRDRRVPPGRDDRRGGRGPARPALPRRAGVPDPQRGVALPARGARASPARAAGRRGRRIRAMDVVVAGGHGQIGLRLLRLLADGGHRARGLVRNPDHVQELAAVGAEAVVCDMEALDDLSGAARAPTRSCSRPAPGRAAGRSASARSTTARP